MAELTEKYQAVPESKSDPGRAFDRQMAAYLWELRQLDMSRRGFLRLAAGSLAADGAGWLAAKGRFLVHGKPLAKLFRGKVRAGLRQLKLEQEVPRETWSKAWVVDCRSVGSGQAALKYLAPYVFRVALSNNRIVSVAND